MNPRKFATDSVHYIHLADPSEEGMGNCENSRITTLFNEDNPPATELSLMVHDDISAIGWSRR